jgi:RNA polymerase sigma-70 factor (ECF subfamily)
VPVVTNILPLLTPSSTAQPMEQSGTRGPDSPIAALTTRMAARDDEAFREFHAQYFDRLLRYHLVLARGDEHAAHEALQETLLRVVRHARRFDDAETFWCWLTVLARSAAADGGRKRNLYWQLIAGYARSLLQRQESSLPDETDPSLQQLLDQSITELEPETRALVEGKYLRRASVRELAAETGLTEKAVESRLLRARRELREKILTKLRHENAP